MSRVELAHRFALPLRDGFDYIVDPRNRPEYWPGLVRVEPGSRWQVPGDRARVVMRLPRSRSPRRERRVRSPVAREAEVRRETASRASSSHDALAELRMVEEELAQRKVLERRLGAPVERVLSR